VKILSVLKSGGDFDGDYVLKLARAVGRNVSVPYTFHCFTDWLDRHEADIDIWSEHGIHPKPLYYGLPAWWSKIEIFRTPGPALYLDLDTVLTGDISDLVRSAQTLATNALVMVAGFKHNDYGSGVMAWNADMSWLIERFIGIPRKSYRDRSNAMRLFAQGRVYRGDQDWITEECCRRKVRIIPIQDIWCHVYSYKHQVRGNRLPDNARIVCFHGRPRPRDVASSADWVEEHWR